MTTPLASLPKIEVSCSEQLSHEQALEWQHFLNNARHQHPRQDTRFAAVERADGRDVLHVMGRDVAGQLRAVGLFSMRRHPFLPGSYIYATCLSGPVCDDAETLVAFLEGVRHLPAFSRVGRIRATPFWTDADVDALERAFAAKGWHIDEAESIRQTGWVELAPPAEEILAAFSKSARRELRRAERQGIVLRPLTRRAEAEEFLASLNRLRLGRKIAPVLAPGFLTAFEEMYAAGDLGVILGAFHEDRFVSGLQLYRSRHVAHGRHFTIEPERLRSMSNLRIAPLVWFEGMRWAKAQGCTALDVEGWRADVRETDYGYGIHKYKGELAPHPVRRIAERGQTVNRPIDAASDLIRHLRRIAKAVLLRMRGRAA